MYERGEAYKLNLNGFATILDEHAIRTATTLLTMAPSRDISPMVQYFGLLLC